MSARPHDSPVQAILFDLDGTLIEPEWEFFLSEANRLFHKMGFPPPSAPEMQRAHARGSLFELFPHERRDELMLAFWQDYRGEHYPHPRPLDGAVAILSELQTLGYRMGIVTARDDSPQKLQQLLEPTGLLPFLDPILSQGVDAPSAKDKTALITQMLTRYQLTPQQAIIVGDSPNDILSGKRCGLRCSVAVLSGGFEFEYLERHEPDYILGDIGELPALLRTLHQK